MSKIILINGKKRSGKDYTAEMLQDVIIADGKSCEIMSFAAPLKRIIAKTFGITLNELENYKNDTEKYNYLIQSKEENNSITILKNGNFRKILQIFGTEAMKEEFGEDVWVKLLYKQVDESYADYIIITDFRFNIEYKDDSITLKIKNDDMEDNDTHASETELNDFNFDYVLDNTGYKLTKDDIINFYEKYLKE